MGFLLSTELPGPNCDLDAGSELDFRYVWLSSTHRVYVQTNVYYYDTRPTKLRIVRDTVEDDFNCYVYEGGVWQLARSLSSSTHRKYLTLYAYANGADDGVVATFDNLVFKFGCPDATPTAWTTTSTSTTTSSSTCSTYSITTTTEAPP